MDKNQKGFSIVEIIIVLAVIAVLGGIYWWVYQKQDNQSVKPPVTNNTSNKTEEEDETEKEVEQGEVEEVKDIPGILVNVDVTIGSAKDLDKLPSITPQSFKDYILAELNKYKDTKCGQFYNISKVSKVNIYGGGGPASEADECLSGAPQVWALAPNGKWEYAGGNGVYCQSENGGKVYEEFAEKCYADTNLKKYINNPNGSITDL